ncbi:MAG: efflux RND transporter periplasmic adaptor subunit [Bacteroidales bacterium]|jgi:cobalt-zinc-cadmium efflux system membrane fusion protein
MTVMNYKISAVLFGLICVVASCSKGGKPATETTKIETLPADIVEMRADQIKLAKIELGTVELRSIGEVLKVNGTVTVAPQNQASVCMPLGGFIKSTSLLPGKAVSKGQTLAIIENQDFVDIQQNYLEAINKLVFAEAEYKRHTSLFKDEVYSEQNVQQVTVEYKNLKTQIKSLEQKLDLIGINASGLTVDNISSTVKLVAPISGYLKTVKINIGKYVAPTDVLFEIVNIDKLLLELVVFEKDADKVAKDQLIRFYINNEAEEHEAVITQTGRSVGSDKTMWVYASVTGDCKNVLPGMYVNALIQESINEQPALPSEAIVSFGDKDYIFVYEREKEEDGKPFTEYRMIEVKKGVSGTGFTAVTLPEGFNAGTAKIVVKGAYNLLSAKKNAGEMAC